MSVSPRIGVLALVLMVASFTPTAAASGCIEIAYTNFGDGLHIIADTGREIAFGFVTGYPGEGIGAVAIITPSLCGGFGVGAGWSDAKGLSGLPGETLAPYAGDPLLLLPLP